MSDATRPVDFPMQIQGGMLEALGINMYTSIGKCLVEFIANAYDSDASSVTIKIPVDAIRAARMAARAAARAEVAAGSRDKFTLLLLPLPEEIVIEISDNGHGMSPRDVEHKYLPINRKRRDDGRGRETQPLSEGGSRFVMGRKGLGKLAGFGAAELIEITTKRKGETFATTFTMDFALLKMAPSLGEVKIPARYDDGLPAHEQGTTVCLSRIKCDAVKQQIETIIETIADAFYGITPDEFRIRVDTSYHGTPNVRDVVAREVLYEYTYAPNPQANGFARGTLSIEDVGDVHFDYQVRFRAREKDEARPHAAFGSLPAARRGARIYCNNRLAAGPSLFGLGTGMHNFHATSYLECVILADELDRSAVDFVNTNRTQLREDNDVVQTLLENVTNVMHSAVAAHAVFREHDAETKLAREIRRRPELRAIEMLPGRQKRAARSILRTLAVTHGYESIEFGELAPLLVQSMNAGDVLIKLIELGSDPGSIERIAHHLAELGEIERQDVLKLYRGRRNGINALRNLIEQGEAQWGKGKRSEKDLHDLLKEQPWLIKPEYSQYLSSDQNLSIVASKLAKILAVDEFFPPQAEGKDDDTRPDLVFVLADSVSPHIISIVELKSPNMSLNIEHLNQLRRYMRQIEEWVRAEYSRAVTIQGYLIGAAPPPDTSAQAARDLLYAIEKRGQTEQWEVLGLEQLIDRAWRVHVEAINLLEKAEEEYAALEAAPAAILLPGNVRAVLETDNEGLPAGAASTLLVPQ
jgi:hypothetical protein